MEINKTCEQYFNAYQELNHWNNHTNWVNAFLVIEVISYFTLVAPFIVLATYTTANLIGRITQTLQPSNLDKQTLMTFKNTLSSSKEDKSSLPSNDLKSEERENGEPLLPPWPQDEEEGDGFGKRHPIIRHPILFKDGHEIDTLSEDDLYDFPPLSQPEKTKTEQFHTNPPIHTNPPKTSSLPQDRKTIFFKNLKADEIEDMKTFNKALADMGLFVASYQVQKLRFQLISNEEATKIVKKFGGYLIPFFSEEQMNHFFSTLKADEFDLKSLSGLFITKEQFEKISNEEAVKLVKERNSQFIKLFSDEQANYFFSNLKAEEMTQKMCEDFFPIFESSIGKKRFELVSDEEALKMAKKFDHLFLWLSVERNKQYGIQYLNLSEGLW